MKNIAIFQSNLNIGGIQRALLNLLNTIDYQKFEIDLYIIEKNNILLNELNNNVNVYYLKKNPYFYKYLPFFIQNKLYKNSITKKYDLAIDFNLFNQNINLACLKVMAKKRILWIHTDLELLRKESHRKWNLIKLLNNKYSFYDKFVMVSKGVYNSFPKKWLINKDYAVIPNILDTKKIDEKSKEPTEINIDKKLLNIVCVARLEPVKQIDIILKYLYELKKVRTDFHFYIIGDGPERKKLEKITNKYKLNNNISFLGYKKNPYSIMKQMDVFILTSKREGQPVCILEAAYLGLKILIPSHLEKYTEIGIKGTENILETLKRMTKNKEKYTIDFEKYNKKILEEFYKL